MIDKTERASDLSSSYQPLSNALADRYRIERQLGQGGMATVYLAHDVKHDRKVAVKVLKPELAAVLGAERFVVEIKTTAALQHPHILPLFDSGSAEGFLYYVMPYIEGETLRAKLRRETQLGIDEALKITTEVADALDYAHRHGVIHRDIKPENILLHDGRPMVADFGIALAVSAAAGGRMTETGLSLGTPHYMSPEQATADKDITGRSDVYSLASVLFEMLAGEPPHMGNSAQQIIMKIIADAARPVTDLRKSVPPHVAGAIAKALEKLPADRFATAAEFGAALKGHIAVSPVSGRIEAPRGASSRRRELALGALVVVSMVIAAWAIAIRPDAAPGREKIEFALRLGAGILDRPLIAISGDGRRIAQIVADSGTAGQIVIRDLGSTDIRAVPGTAGAEDVSLSHDGTVVYFNRQRAIWRISSEGGPAVRLAEPVSGGVHLFADGSLIYSGAYSGLFKLPASGGAPQELTRLDTARKEFAHWNPQALPGDRVAIFNSFSTPIERSRIEAVDLESGNRTVLVERAVMPSYVRSGHLLFVRDGAIFAVPFDPGELRVLGPEVPVIDDVAYVATDGVAGYALDQRGTLVYLKGSLWNVDRRVVWVDRTGRERPAIEEHGHWSEPRLSPDGRWIAVTRLQPDRQVWLFDRARRVLTQATRLPGGVAFNPVWLPDSRSMIVTSETPVYDLFRVPIDGRAPDTVVASPYDKYATSTSPDGRRLIYQQLKGHDQLWQMQLADGRGKPTAFDDRDPAQRNGMFSPDGRWIAFEEMSADGSAEIFVTSAAGSGARRQVSAGGGTQPRWTKGGRELVFRDGNHVLAAPFHPATGEPGTPVRLFSKSDRGRLGADRTIGYDVTPDGAEFLMVLQNERENTLPLVVIVNWLEELKRKIPR